MEVDERRSNSPPEGMGGAGSGGDSATGTGAPTQKELQRSTQDAAFEPPPSKTRRNRGPETAQHPRVRTAGEREDSEAGGTRTTDTGHAAGKAAEDILDAVLPDGESDDSGGRRKP